MNISNISKNRTQLMGIAILMIMLCHNSLVFNSGFNHLNDIARTFLQIGVDIFFMLSGFGCYFSMKKSKSVWHFYKKRVMRILPTYIFIIAMYAVFSCFILKNDIRVYLYKYSLISFFIDGNLSEWFIAAILVLYFLFPLVYQWIEKSDKSFNVLILVIVFLSLFISILMNNNSSIYVINEIFISRIPIFLLGIVIGKLSYDKQDFELKKNILIGLFILSIILYVLNYYYNTLNMLTITKYIFIPIVFSGTLLISGIINETNLHIFNKIINEILLFLGSVTLEIYLIHEKLMGITYFICKHIFFSESMILLVNNIIAIILAPLLAWIVHKIISKIILCFK